ncbi:MAG TPA: 2-oxoacid:acceptor oxidoreductase family protein [Candidatus Binatia bacterium]|nr:2-oxoacid:acceptor oxidoreductase family protein [Candidatus Binatia bacterium]
MIARLRFHGRGGEGVKLASRIVSRAAFLAGRVAQDAPLYGAERRGAPVVAFVRLADRGPITERGYVERPDAVVVMDDSLLAQPEAGVLEGVSRATLVLANSRAGAEALRARFGVAARVVALDVSRIALASLGRHVLSAPTAGFTAKVAGLAGWDEVARAVETELAEVGLAADLVARNLAATRRAFEAAPLVGIAPGREAPAPAAAPRGFVVPRLPAAVAAPSVLAAGTSALKTTEGWRVSRPVIDLGRCTRCFLCFALCPEGAISLDASSYPIIDYQHCKGCLVCVTECPPRAIAEVREPVA